MIIFIKKVSENIGLWLLLYILTALYTSRD